MIFIPHEFGDTVFNIEPGNSKIYIAFACYRRGLAKFVAEN